MPDGRHRFPALAPDADFRPLCYSPQSVWFWQYAVKALFLARASVLREHEILGYAPRMATRPPCVTSNIVFVVSQLVSSTLHNVVGIAHGALPMAGALVA